MPIKNFSRTEKTDLKNVHQVLFLPLLLFISLTFGISILLRQVNISFKQPPMEQTGCQCKKLGNKKLKE